MASIKILHIYKTSNPLTFGGVESVISNLQNYSSDHICSDVACIGNETNAFKHNSSNIYVFKKTFEFASCPVSLKMLFSLGKLVRSYDIIHFHYPWPFGDLISLLFCRNKKKITTYHSDIVKQKVLKYFYWPLEKFFLRSQDKIIYTSPQYMKSSINLYRYKDKCTLIPIGIKALEDFSSPSFHSNLPKKYFIFVGVLRYYKGVHILLEAIKNSSHNLVIVGDGSYRSTLEKKSKLLGIQNRVFFVGKTSDEEKNFLIKNSICLVLPSHLKSEAYGVVLLEAMSVGVPIISCKIGTGTEYINQNNITGFCVKPNSIAIRKAMDKIDTIKTRKYFSKNCYSRFKKYFTADIMFKKYLALYKNICH